MGDNTIVLKATHKGLIGQYVNNTIWLAVAILVLLVLRWGAYTLVYQADVPDYTMMTKLPVPYSGGIPHIKMDRLGFLHIEESKPIYKDVPMVRKAQTLGEFWKYGLSNEWRKDLLEDHNGLWWRHQKDTAFEDNLGWWALIIIIGFISTIILIFSIISMVNTYYDAKSITAIDKDTLMISYHKYGFPNQHESLSLKFHYMVLISVHQNSFQRYNNTGGLNLHLMTKTGSEVESRNWWIEAIEDPESARLKIWDNLPQIHELEIKTN